MASSLSTLVDNLKNFATVNAKIADLIKVKNKLLIFKCLKCNKNHKKYFKDLVKRLSNTYNFCDGNIKKRSLSLRIHGSLRKT